MKTVLTVNNQMAADKCCKHGLSKDRWLFDTNNDNKMEQFNRVATW